MRLAIVFMLLVGPCATAQVYSPQVLAKGQPDPSNLRRFAAGIYDRYSAHTDREKAEAIWRFFLTDGRFVEPGFWYHIAGWAYEEPAGEVLDPMKLLNSYGFGLCYQIAPLLEATWKAGGFADARVWFLTGHTVAEVLYDGAYHYYDSDMMGYNTLPDGSVASVRQIEQDGSLILKSKAPSTPWYPADVRAGAIGELAGLFTSVDDNRLFAFERAPAGHSMDFVLRPNEKLIRYFKPERPDVYYLPFRNDKGEWSEFPREIKEYDIRTQDGPRSQKDGRTWATGRIEYSPPAAEREHEVASPYVIIGADFYADLKLASAHDAVAVETSTDGGRSWVEGVRIHGPYDGRWRGEPAVVKSASHGRLTAVSGRYAYRVRFSTSGSPSVRNVLIATSIQLNPRTLPAVAPGANEFTYSAGPRAVRHEVPVDAGTACGAAYRCRNARYVSDGSQGYWTAEADGTAEIVFRVGGGAAALHVGGRFLDLSAGLAPDKFTAEVRRVDPLPAKHPEASLAWSASPDGPYTTVWTYDPATAPAGVPADRVLRWPEVDRDVQAVGGGEFFVRYRVRDLAIDQFRLAFETRSEGASPLRITHAWLENGARKTAVVDIAAGRTAEKYKVVAATGAAIENEYVVFEASPKLP